MTRVQTLLDIAKSAGLDAVALIPGAHLQYLTGLDFHLSERPLVIFFTLTQEPVAIAPALEADRLAGCGFPIQIFPWSDTEGYQGAFAAALDALQLDGKQLGIEELRMRVLEANTIQTYAPGAQIVSAGKTLAALRMHKDDAAIASMRQAIQISQDALEALIPQIKPGMTEREVAGLLVVEQLKRGGGKHPFEPIVLSGPRSALPHGEPGDRQIALGEPLLFDFGTTVNGYASDITRTFSVGEPSAKMQDVYAVVKAANAAGRAAAKPGATGQDVDRATRKVIVEAGFGDYFTHRTGHGLGLETHEPPDMVEGNLLVLEPGMTFTVEPGIYLSGEVGVRIEDNVVITVDGAESLTTFDRELRVIG